MEVDIIRVEEPEESGVESAQLDARRGATLAVRKIPAGSGMGLTVVLQKLIENRNPSRKGSSYAATAKISAMNLICSLTAAFSTF